MLIRTGAGVAALLFTSAVVGQQPPSPAPASAAGGQAQRCAAMMHFALGDLPLKITATNHVAAVPPGTPGPDSVAPPSPMVLPAHCRIEGVINERSGEDGKSYGIRFALALPDEWSGRFLLQGGGGLNGSVNPPLGIAAAGDAPALTRGFAVISHDSGHRGTVWDRSFMADQRANLDFAESAVPVVARLGKALTAAYYGRAIEHSYMAGCSTGGRESMLAVQRHPDMFDGIVVGAPAMRTGNSNLGTSYAAVQFNQAAPRDAAGLPIVERIFSDADRNLILNGLLAQCDGLDGLKDGVIENVKGCHFQPAKLRCPGKAKTAVCLSAAQVTALDRAFAGPRDKAGYPLYASVPFDTGIVATNGRIPGYLPTGKPGPFGPANRDLTIDLDARIEAIRADMGQRLTDTDVWTNLNGFLGHGGKIIFYHGVSDPWFSALDTLDYWQRAEKQNGAGAWAQASRFYMVPGMGHCSGGANTFDDFDLLGAVVAWVEKGQAPEAVPSRRRAPTPAERPMCPWPRYPHYIGGEVAKPESFECRAPAS